MNRAFRMGGLALVILAGGVGAAHAQPGPGKPAGRPGGPLGGEHPLLLLRSEAVQQELGLSPEQKQQLQDLAEQARRSMGSELQSMPPEQRRAKMAEMLQLSPEERRAKLGGFMQKLGARHEEVQAKLNSILQPQQLARLEEISIQVRGVAALVDPKVQAALKLSEDQKQKLAGIQQRILEKARSMMPKPGDFQGPGSFDRQAAVEKMEKARQEVNQEALQVLTPEQREAFEKMKGKKFELPMAGPAASTFRGGLAPRAKFRPGEP